jgi:hypothetical protein
MASNEEMSTTINRLTSGLINAILGALILWVGQTTFRHAGVLAGMDEKLKGVQHQFEDIEKRCEGLKNWLQSAVSDMKDSTRTQFTMKDGDKLVAQVRQAEHVTADLERRFVERLNTLEIKLSMLETRHSDTQEVAALKGEIWQIRNELARAAAVQEAQLQQLQSGDRFARGTPSFLPPVDSRR